MRRHNTGWSFESGMFLFLKDSEYIVNLLNKMKHSSKKWSGTTTWLKVFEKAANVQKKTLKDYEIDHSLAP